MVFVEITYLSEKKKIENIGCSFYLSCFITNVDDLRQPHIVYLLLHRMVAGGSCADQHPLLYPMFMLQVKKNIRQQLKKNAINLKYK